MKIKSFILVALCMVTVGVYAQKNYSFNGLDMGMGNLSKLSNAKTRSISPENFTGEKGKGGMADPVTLCSNQGQRTAYYNELIQNFRARLES